MASRTREQDGARKRAMRVTAREIGRIPRVKQPKRRKLCAKNLETFCREYFPERFAWAFSPDHVKAIRKIEQAIFHGGLFAWAMPRGSGKTTLVVAAVLWAILNGHLLFVAIICSDQDAAENLLRAVLGELEHNNRLLEDYPEACYPVRKLESIRNRAPGQLCAGKPTSMSLQSDKIVLPTTKRNRTSSGSVVQAFGINGRIRGAQHTRADGKVIRPDFVVLDDPQTDESARSESQCDERERSIKSAVLGLAGPGKHISGVMPCTVIRAGDVADRFLDPKENPEWHGEKMKLIYSWPARLDLWEQYTEIRRAEQMRDDAGHNESRGFYEANRAEMDRGAAVAWEARKGAGELSALQHAMHLRDRVGETAFAAEYQNDPIKPTQKMFVLDIDTVRGRVNGLRAGQLPQNCPFVVAGVDVNLYGLHWCVLAARNDFAVHVIGYGRFPRSGVLWSENSGEILDQAVFRGAADLVETLYQTYPALTVVVMDGNYMTRTIHQVAEVCNRRRTAPVRVARGWPAEKYRPLPEKDAKLIGRLGHRCHYQVGALGKEISFDSHYWHLAAQRAFLVAPGASGSTSFWGDANTNHREFAEHVCAERLTDYFIHNGEARYTWHKNGRNDYMDALCMGMTGLSILGADPNIAAQTATGNAVVAVRRTTPRVARVRSVDL